MTELNLESAYCDLNEKYHSLLSKYKDLLNENKKLEEQYNMHLRVIFDSQENIDKYCDFDMLISQMKKQNQKYNEMKELLEKCVKYFENGCSDEEKWVTAQDIKKVIE